MKPFKSWENTSEYDWYIRLPYEFLDHKNTLSLSGNALKLYIAMRMVAARDSNTPEDVVTFTLRTAMKFLKVSEPSANKALLELEQKGYTKRLNKSREKRLATEWQFVSDWQSIEPNAKSQDGFIYVIKSGNEYKIGRTRNPSQRMKTFESLPEPIDEIICKKVYQHYFAEKALHKTYEDKRIFGEWFNLTQKDLIDIENYLSEHEVKCEKEDEDEY